MIIQSVAELVKRVEELIGKVNVNATCLVWAWALAWVSFSFADGALKGLIQNVNSCFRLKRIAAINISLFKFKTLNLANTYISFSDVNQYVVQALPRL